MVRILTMPASAASCSAKHSILLCADITGIFAIFVTVSSKGAYHE